MTTASIVFDLMLILYLRDPEDTQLIASSYCPWSLVWNLRRRSVSPLLNSQNSRPKTVTMPGVSPLKVGATVSQPARSIVNGCKWCISWENQWKSSINGGFSIAMFDHQRVNCTPSVSSFGHQWVLFKTALCIWVVGWPLGKLGPWPPKHPMAHNYIVLGKLYYPLVN